MFLIDASQVPWANGTDIASIIMKKKMFLESEDVLPHFSSFRTFIKIVSKLNYTDEPPY